MHMGHMCIGVIYVSHAHMYVGHTPSDAKPLRCLSQYGEISLYTLSKPLSSVRPIPLSLTSCDRSVAETEEVGLNFLSSQDKRITLNETYETR